jgi:hypothetical protein
MKKIALGLCLSVIVFLGACGSAPTPTQAQCVGSNKADGNPNCLPLSPTTCCRGLSLQKDETNCPVGAGLVGGMPMRCLPVGQECVRDNVCVAANPTLRCCDASKRLQKDSTMCPTSGLLGGNTMMCM